jgi:transaldolase
MGLYIDTADLAAIERALAEHPYLAGITTNPILIKRAGVAGKEAEFFRAVRQLTAKPLFAQVLAGSTDEMRHHAYDLFKAVGENVILKIPFCPEGLRACRELSPTFKTCVTAVANPVQGFAAATLGARWAALYVGRVEDDGRDGLRAVEETAGILHARGLRTRVLAASIRKAEWVTRLLALPNVDVTVGPEMLTGLVTDPVTLRAVTEFRGLARSQGA